MRVDTSLLHGIAAANQHSTAQASSLKSTGTTTSFSSALKSASAKETTKPVDGQKYSEILTGPRAGMYMNTGGGPRDGEAFILVKHDGREDHIYGTGKDRKVVTVSDEKASSTDKTSSSGTTDKTSSSTDTSSATTDKAPSGEKTTPVTGRGYADITSGSRSGLYLNTSGNVRDGKAFALVKRDGHEFHIYGTGKNREVIGLHAADCGHDDRRARHHRHDDDRHDRRRHDHHDDRRLVLDGRRDLRRPSEYEIRHEPR